MGEVEIDLGPLAKAVASLRQAVDRSHMEPSDTMVRDAVIQRFEYTYELSWKALNRFLEWAEPAINRRDIQIFKNLIREAARIGVITNPLAWFEYREMRNITSHTYDEDKAKRVFEAAKLFLIDVEALLKTLYERFKP